MASTDVALLILLSEMANEENGILNLLKNIKHYLTMEADKETHQYKTSSSFDVSCSFFCSLYELGWCHHRYAQVIETFLVTGNHQVRVIVPTDTAQHPRSRRAEAVLRPEVGFGLLA